MADGGAPKPKQQDIDDLLAEAKECFSLTSDNESEDRIAGLDDIRFARLSEQWPSEVRRRRELDGRPCQTINVLPTYIRQVVNDGRQNRPQINVHPASDGADQEVAEIYNGLIRNIEATSDADVAYDTALDAAVTHGWGYFRINTRYADDDSFLQDLVIEPVHNPFSIWGDPYCIGADSADWDTAFVTERLPLETFERKYKGAEAVDWEADYTSMGTPWVEGETVMLAEWWKREETARPIVMMSDGAIMDLDTVKQNLELFRAIGLEPTGQTRIAKSHKVTQYLLTGAEILEVNAWPGKYIPIIPVYGEVVNLEGRRYLRGLVRDAKDSQQNINFMRTAAVEAIGYAPKAPFIGPKGAFATDADKWETANVDSHAYIEYDGATAPERQPFPGVPQGYIQAVNDAASDLKAVIGLQNASLGQPGNETSGRAILARMREGDVSTFHYVDNLSRAIRHAGRVLIDLIPKVYSVPRMIRTLRPDGSTQQVPVNQPTQVPQMGPDGKPAMAPAPPGPDGQPPQGPDGNPLMQPQIVSKVFDLTVGKYDLTVEAGPGFTTRREEAATQMMELVRADPAVLPVIGDLLVKNLDWPGADEIAQRLQQNKAEQSQPKPDPKVQAEIAGNQAKAQADQQAQAAKAAADHQLAQQKLQNDMQLNQQKLAAEMAMQRQKMEGEMQLARERAAFDAKLAEESLQMTMAVKVAEARAKLDQTVETPETTIGGGVG